MRSATLKRLLDLLGATVGLAIGGLPMLVTALLIRRTMGAPVLFRQERPGLHGKPFTIYKFRTMWDDRAPDGRLLPDAERLTPLGEFLRSYSLDELPELLNVLKGEMSLVGPRPLLVQYLLHYTQHQARRHEVKPGITGWAQVNGRNTVDWNERFDMDVWYVDNWSVMLDLKILWLTVLSVVKKQGISAEGKAAGGRWVPTPETDHER
jgi:sugar transferase EpsL